ncbi:MAG TPA: hypothetical protein PLF81_02255 [Candidatus Anammoximicrobium sp.]|nr:hypothetical protein [Candidatus Anammoximicrobium sp.]
MLIDGQPLTHGFVQVIPKGNRAATGEIGADGRFSLTTFTPGDGCVPGRHPAAVIATESINATSQRWHAPKKYADVTRSGLEVNVEKATDNLEIQLSWNGGRPFVESFEAEQ